MKIAEYGSMADQLENGSDVLSPAILRYPDIYIVRIL